MSRHNRKKKMSGYIKLHRAIEHHWLWLDPRRFQWWIQLLFMAAWEPKQITFGNVTINLQRGQIATTTRMLMKQFMCCNQTVFKFLAVLENNNMIVKETNQKMTLITIVNYELYQQESAILSATNSSQKSISEDRIPHRKVEQIKEERNNEEKNINISLSPSRERDLEFLEELRNSEVFFEQCAMTLKIEISALKEYFKQFSAEMLLQEKYHDSFKDYRQHFINWVKIQSHTGPRPYINNNGTRQKETSNKREARRGTDVGNHTADDFGGAF